MRKIREILIWSLNLSKLKIQSNFELSLEGTSIELNQIECPWVEDTKDISIEHSSLDASLKLNSGGSHVDIGLAFIRPGCESICGNDVAVEISSEWASSFKYSKNLHLFSFWLIS